ncbi:unnamed protein product [Euphydryas editha]|uniref:Copia protein n=1 Tax=Euphydryas editha TaxID=104508 RepID=A0AAU9TEL1_EUPED|nr:unnamed protein product [Euphydryas editha]
MAGNYILNVPKLRRRENFGKWAFAVENFLILEGVDINKEDAKNGGNTASVDEQKAIAKLVMTIDPSLYVHIKSEKTVQSMWKKLKSLFRVVTLVSHAELACYET